jgi:hypothetical protein
VLSVRGRLEARSTYGGTARRGSASSSPSWPTPRPGTRLGDRCRLSDRPGPDLRPVPREFFDRPVLEVAPDLLGAVVEHRSPLGVVAVRLTEVEAYDGERDPGSHAFRGRTPRNAVMFGRPGTSTSTSPTACTGA